MYVSVCLCVFVLLVHIQKKMNVKFVFFTSESAAAVAQLVERAVSGRFGLRIPAATETSIDRSTKNARQQV